jgi:hypothetical protein
MPSQKRSLNERDELDDRHDAKRQAFDASVLPSPPSSSPQKRHLDVDGGQQSNAKRKALEAPIFPTPLSPVTSRKRPLEVDDTNQPHAKRRVSLPNKSLTVSFRQKDRMELYERLRACRTWEPYCQLLNAIPKTHEFTIALALNDSAEWARLRALSQLDAQLHSKIINIISEIQMDKSRYDPNSLFPCVATKDFMKALPSSAHTCNICRQDFLEGFDIVWKFCGSHSLHQKCFRENVDQMPLMGVCNCILDV